MHADGLKLDTSTVRRLVAEQCPAWADLPIERLDGPGTVNAIFRVGADAVARFPLRFEDPALVRARLRREAEAAAAFRAVCPFPAPVPLHLGKPGPGFPLPWSAQTWLPGATATPTSCAESDGLVDDLVALITALRAADTEGRVFAGDGRGGRLADHDDWVEECIHRSGGLHDQQRLRRAWAGFRSLPAGRPDVMSHTDPIPWNLLVAHGRLVGVLDTGGYQPADPALDLVVAWHLFEAGPRERLRLALGSDDLEWERGRAWAFQQALGAHWYYLDTNPPMAEMGRTTLRRILDAG